MNEALERLRRLGQEMRLRPSHPYLVRLRRAPGLNFVIAGRKNRYLIIVIEERRPAACWTSRKTSRNNCVFEVFDLKSDTFMNTIAGEPLSQLSLLPYRIVGADHKKPRLQRRLDLDKVRSRVAATSALDH